MYTVYLLVARESGQVIYVGCTNDVVERYQQHLSRLRHRTHTAKILQKYFDEFGPPDLEISFTEPNRETAFKLERGMQKAYNVNERHNYEGELRNSNGMAELREAGLI